MRLSFHKRGSVWGLVQTALDDGEFLKIENYQAEDKGGASVRVETGETVDSTKKGFVSVSPKRTVGNDRLNILLSLRDMGSRQEDDSFGWRSMIVASLDPSGLTNQRIKTIKMTKPFKTFEGVDLNDLPVFPELFPIEGKVFIELFVERKVLKDLIKLIDQNIVSLKAKVKKTTSQVVSSAGSVQYFPPSGTTRIVVDEAGNEVKKVPKVHNNGGKLELCQEIGEPEFVRTKEIEKLPELFELIERHRDRVEEINSVIRPFECGLIERNLENGKVIIVDGVDLKVVLFNVVRSEFPVMETNWTVSEKPASRGKWVFVPSVKVGVETTEEVSQIK